MKVSIKYCLLILLLASKMSFGQSFITKVSAATIGKKDVIEVEYVAENVSLEQFTLPRFKKWTIVSGPNLSSSTMQTGNMVRQQTVYSVMLQPTETGTLQVPGATALIDNKPQRSNSISIKVKNVDHLQGNSPPAPSPPSSLFDQVPSEDRVPSNQYLKKGEKAIDKIKNNILVRLEVNKRSCYVGEPILATYKLCTRLRSKSKVVKQPQFSGCTVVELTSDEQEARIEKINGVEYNVFVIRKVALFPLNEGKLVLPETSVENRVSFYNAGNLTYKDLYYGAPVPEEEQLVTLENKPDVIEVKALPPMPAASGTDFSGAIGNFDIHLSIADEAPSANNTNHLYFVVQGEGNLQPVKAPLITWPKGIEAFEATEKDETDKKAFPIKSRKIFDIPFVADAKGNYMIPAVQFTYFDAGANKYVTKTTSALMLKVAPGSKKFFASKSAASKDAEGFQSRLYILLGAGFFAVVIGLVWYNGRQKTQVKPAASVLLSRENVVEVKQPETAEYLYKIRALQPELDSSLFYKQLCTHLRDYTRTKYNIEPTQLQSYIEDQHPEQEEYLQQLKGLLDDCSLGMYTPVYTIEEAMQHRLLAIQVLSVLEKEAPHSA